MNFEAILTADTFALYLGGLWMTVKLLLACVALGFLLSVPLAVARNSRLLPVSKAVWAFTYVVRGTPLLLQMYLIYYGLSQFEAVRNSFAWTALSEPLFCAVAALTINTVGYTTEIFAGAIRSLPYGEIEAANAYGMSRWTNLRRIILPSALRASLPTYSNEVIMMLHATSLVSTITLLDLTGAANRIYSTYYLPFEAFMVAAAVYMVLTYILVRGFRYAEWRYLAYQRPQEVK
ncbi:ABC transporter permease [Herminiimonas sp. CN]|uniref:ABC transporter permease n=1 Tax=Herminiimonas sp. CN TaxID=1349818 RepID=UPI0004737861|nr:ABC transporter permease [Herminiimonas sp. CN]